MKNSHPLKCEIHERYFSPSQQNNDDERKNVAYTFQ